MQHGGVAMFPNHLINKKRENEKMSEEIVKTPEMERIEALMEKVDRMIEPEKFDELETKYKQLLKDYTERRPAPKKEKKQELKPVAEYAAELSRIGNQDAPNPLDVTNRNYIKLSVDYRDAYMKETGNDPWTDDTGPATEQTKKVAGVYKQLLQDYESPIEFSRALTDLMVDDKKLLRALADKRAQEAKKNKRK
jgi:hypothetical protein